MITHDLRYGWRLMLRRPGFTAVAVLTLGLGIGANVTIYSWVEALLLRPIPVVDTSRIAAMTMTAPGRTDLSLSYPNFVDLRERRPAGVEDLIAYRILPGQRPDRRRGAARVGLPRQRQLLRRPRREAGARPRLPARGGSHAGRSSGRRLQRQLLAPSFRRRPVDRRPNGDAQQPGVHRRRRRAARLQRQRRGARRRRLRADDDADDGHARQPARTAGQRLAAGDGQAETRGDDRRDAAGVRRRGARSGRGVSRQRRTRTAPGSAVEGARRGDSACCRC